MLSTFPATNMSFDPFFSNLFPLIEGGFTSWDFPETAFDDGFPAQPDQQPVLSPVQEPEPEPEPVISNSGSESDNSNSNPNPAPANSNSGSDEPSRKRTRPVSESGMDDPNQDERKRRRMISNRESARRSRMRKQKHLENLRNQVNRLRVENRELLNRFRFASNHCHLVQSDNDRLRAESSLLRQRLWDIRQVLLVRQLQHRLSVPAWAFNNNINNSNNVEQRPQSLITR